MRAGKVFLDKNVSNSARKFLASYKVYLLGDYAHYYNDFRAAVELFLKLKSVFVFCHFTNRCITHRESILGSLITYFKSILVDDPAVSEHLHMVTTLQKHLALPNIPHVALHAGVPISYYNSSLCVKAGVRGITQRREFGKFLKGKIVVNHGHSYYSPKEVHYCH